MAFVLDEKLTTKWFDTLTVIPDDGDNVWFIVGDKIYVGKYIAEARVFTKADKSMVDLSCVRQWSPMNGEKQICKQPEEDQVVAAKIPNLPCYVTGIYSSNLSQKNLGIDGPGLLLDQDYNISELGVKSPVSWEEVFDWYELPLEPLLLLPVIQVGLVPITYGELMSNQICLDCQCEESKPQETEQTEPKPTSAIVASKNRNLMEKNIEDKPMNNKLTETRVSYELTKYGSYQPWGQAKEAWQYILDNGKFDDLDSYLEEMYPEGIDETDLNDILAYEPESVYEAIGLDDPNAEEIWEHDNDFYDPEAPESEDEEEPIAEESYKGFDIYTWEGDLITVCKNGKYKSDADDIADAKRMIDEGILNESKKSNKNKLYESGDGWQDDVEYVFKDAIHDSEQFAYEIRNCRRGVYTNAYTTSELAECARKIAGVWENAADECEYLKDEIDESKKSDSKRLTEDYGWSVTSGKEWDLLDELIEAFGAEEMLTALAKAMGTYELGENLAFICRNYDFNSPCLDNYHGGEFYVSDIDWAVDDPEALKDLPNDATIKADSEDDVIDELSNEYGFLVNGVGSIEKIDESKKSDKTEENHLKESNEKVEDKQDFSHLPESLSKQVSDFFNLIKF